MKTYHQFAGQRALTANKEMLQRAMQLENAGVGKERILRETSWWKDSDLHWKFEISDEKMAFKEGWRDTISLYGGAYLSDLIEHDDLFEAHPMLELTYIMPIDEENGDVGYNGTFSRSTKRIEIKLSLDDTKALSVLAHEITHRIQDYEGFARGSNCNDGNKRRLIEYLYDSLELSERVKRDWSDNNHKYIYGAASARSDSVYCQLFKSYLKMVEYATCDKPTSVLRHIKGEAAWIQSDIFKNERGSLSEKADEVYREWYLLPKSDYKGKKTSFLRNICIMSAQLYKSQIPKELFEEFKLDNRQINSMVMSYQRESFRAKELTAPIRTVEDEANLITKMIDDITYKSNYELYSRATGEVQARLVQARLGLTSEERKSRNVWADMDWPADKHIPIVGGEIPWFASIKGMSEELALSAQIDFGGDCYAKILISPVSDASSIVHESAHYFLEVYSDLNQKDGVNPELKEDFSQILNWLGVSEVDWYSMDEGEKSIHHERFAEGFEDYLMTNESPLSAVFEKFKDWLTAIYDNLTNSKLTSCEGAESIFEK